MGAGTYPDSEVQKEIQNHFIPVQFNVVERPEVMEQFNTPWTPTLIFEDAEGREHRRSQGYLDPKRLLGEAALARLNDAIDRRDFQTAVERVDAAKARTEGDSHREPEALYWAAVARYKAADNVDNLLAGWNDLLDRFPESEWAKKAGFIRM